MAKTFTHSFTPEKLQTLDRNQLLTIRGNAARKGASDLIQMCDEELASRTPKQERKRKEASGRTVGEVVVGYHFVCSQGRGVSEDVTGRFRSGSWVVAEANVVESLRYGAYIALHENKNELSYRQGQIVGYSHTPRDMIDKENMGIEFLVEETRDPYTWIGEGTGEKGYNWSKRSSQISPEDEA